VWRQGRTRWVRVVAGVDRRLRLRNPFGEEPFETSGPTPRREGADLVADLAAGQEILLRVKGEPAGFDEAARGVRQGDVSRIGLR
jgi:hypothetical protein